MRSTSPQLPRVQTLTLKSGPMSGLHPTPVLILAALTLAWLLASRARAERMVLDDGTVLEGELVGFENGTYRLRMGKFVKSIPESRVQDIEGLEPGGGSGTGGAPAGAGSAASGSQSADDVLRKALQDAGIANPEDVSRSDAVQQTMDQLLGGRSQVSEQDMEELNQNPSILKLMDTYRNPEYQRSLLEAAQQMQEDLNPDTPNPQIDALKQLFDQLNELR